MFSASTTNGLLLAYGTSRGIGGVITIGCVVVLLVGIGISMFKIIRSGSRNGK